MGVKVNWVNGVNGGEWGRGAGGVGGAIQHPNTFSPLYSPPIAFPLLSTRIGNTCDVHLAHDKESVSSMRTTLLLLKCEPERRLGEAHGQLAQVLLKAIQCDAMRCDVMRYEAIRCDVTNCNAMRSEVTQCDRTVTLYNAVRCDAM